jgi:hypothetical protein
VAVEDSCAIEKLEASLGALNLALGAIEVTGGNNQKSRLLDRDGAVWTGTGRSDFGFLFFLMIENQKHKV